MDGYSPVDIRIFRNRSSHEAQCASHRSPANALRAFGSDSSNARRCSMKINFLLATLALMVVGCGDKGGKTTNVVPPGAGSTTKVRPANVTSVKVALVDTELKFVVLDCTLVRMPKPLSKLQVYRDGEKVGELVTTSQVEEAFLVADISKGEIKVGDEARIE